MSLGLINVERSRVARVICRRDSVELAQVIVGNACEFSDGESLGRKATDKVGIVVRSPAAVATANFETAAGDRRNANINRDQTGGNAGDFSTDEVGRIRGTGNRNDGGGADWNLRVVGEVEGERRSGVVGEPYRVEAAIVGGIGDLDFYGTHDGSCV